MMSKSVWVFLVVFAKATIAIAEEPVGSEFKDESQTCDICLDTHREHRFHRRARHSGDQPRR